MNRKKVKYSECWFLLNRAIRNGAEIEVEPIQNLSNDFVPRDVMACFVDDLALVFL